MKYIKTPRELYNQYITEHGTDRIEKGVKLITNDIPFSILKKLHLNEIKFNSLKTEYKQITKQIDDSVLYTYIFKCESDNEYKLELLQIDPENYWLDEKHFNISFTLSNRNFDTYADVNNYGELFELFKRIMFILNDINKNVIYVVGHTLDKRKNLLYKDFIDNFENYEVKDAISVAFNDKTYYIKKKNNLND